MSKNPYMPLFVDAFLADTLHLTAAEVGAYALLLMAMWRHNGFVPDNDKDLSRITRSGKRWKKIKARLAPMLAFEGGVVTQKRLLKEWNHSTTLRKKQSENARVRWNKNNKLSDATASVSHIPNACPHTHTHIKETTNVVSIRSSKRAKPKKRISEDWHPRVEDIKTLSSEGFSFSEIEDQVRRFRDYWAGNGRPMADWGATFRNWVRKSADFGRGPPNQPKRDGMRIALDKLGGNRGKGLGSLSEFLALSDDDSGGEGIVGSHIEQGASDCGGQAHPLSLSKSEQSD